MKKTISAVVTVAMIVVAVGGCAGGGVAEKPADQVSVQLKWIHQAQFAGIYAADRKGFYADENIDVTIKPGGIDIPPDRVINDLIAGETAFAIVGAEHLLKARSQDKPIVAVAVVFQRNPYVYVSLKDSGIQRPQDFVGKKVMVGSDGEVQHQALLKKLDIDPNAVIKITPYQRDVTLLLTGQIDAHMMYRTGTGLAFDETGLELNFIWVDDYGIRLYADTIVASEELVRQNPELVERFLSATLRGWYYAIENPAEAVDMTLQYDPTLGRDRQTLMMETQTPLIHTGEAEIGRMADSVWQQMHQMLLDGGVLTQPINVADAYTMEFLEKIYGRTE
jgi:NitT/TauT family transport system substrate-binding protein